MSPAEIADVIGTAVRHFAPDLPPGLVTASFVGALVGREIPVGDHIPVHDALNALRDLTGAAEESDMLELDIELIRDAYQEVCALLGDPNPPEGNYRHEAVQVTRAMVDEARGGHHAGAMSEYLQSLMEFHLIDDDHQAADPLVNIERITADELAVSTESGRRYTVVVNEAP